MKKLDKTFFVQNDELNLKNLNTSNFSVGIINFNFLKLKRTNKAS